MDTRAQQYAAQFEAVNNDMIAAVEECNEQQWREPCEGDDRSVAVVAHHVAITNQTFAGMIARLASGDTYTPDSSMDDVHRMNAEHASEHVAVERQDVLDLLRTSGDTMVEQLTFVSDARLDGAAGVFGGNPLTVAQVIEYVIVGHTAEHLQTIRASIGRQPAA